MAITYHPLLWEDGDSPGLYDIARERHVCENTPPVPSIPVSLINCAHGTQGTRVGLNTLNSATKIAAIEHHPHSVKAWYGYNDDLLEIPTVITVTPTYTSGKYYGHWDFPNLPAGAPPLWLFGAPIEWAAATTGKYVHLDEYPVSDPQVNEVRLWIDINELTGFFTIDVRRPYITFDMNFTPPAGYVLSEAYVTVTHMSTAAQNMILNFVWDQSTGTSTTGRDDSDSLKQCYLYPGDDQRISTTQTRFWLDGFTIARIKELITADLVATFSLRCMWDFPEMVLGRVYNLQSLNFHDASAYPTTSALTLLYNLEPSHVLTVKSDFVYETEANMYGDVTSAGGGAVTEKGAVWSHTNSNPTTADHKVAHGNTAIGTYAVTATGLTPGTLTYFKAYSINPAGTSYGSVMTFTTASADAPTVTTASASGVTSTEAYLGGEVTDIGGSGVYERGIVWSYTNVNPTTADNKNSNGSGIGAFVELIGGFAIATEVYFNAYAINTQGTGYGTATSFTTGAASIPTVTITSVSNITDMTAIGHGNVTSDGGGTVTSRGMCWSESSGPTIADFLSYASTGGTGTYTANLTSLLGETWYYVRAWAVNGAGIAYSTVETQVYFQTGPPT